MSFIKEGRKYMENPLIENEDNDTMCMIQREYDILIYYMNQIKKNLFLVQRETYIQYAGRGKGEENKKEAEYKKVTLIIFSSI